MMRSARLFAAIAFAPAEKRELHAVSQIIQGGCAAGRFPAMGLLHVTLHFFGQTGLDRLGAFEAAMKQAASGISPFTMATGRAGTFGRSGSQVLWLGIDGGASELKALQAALEHSLAAQGFPSENREFKAHITIGRDVRLVGDVASIELPSVPLHVGGITLMESTQASGKLEYVPLITMPFIHH